jgi:hypothetical protein
MSLSSGRKVASKSVKVAKPVRTLAVDIGASGVKVVVLNQQGEPMT